MVKLKGTENEGNRTAFFSIRYTYFVPILVLQVGRACNKNKLREKAKVLRGAMYVCTHRKIVVLCPQCLVTKLRKIDFKTKSQYTPVR